MLGLYSKLKIGVVGFAITSTAYGQTINQKIGSLSDNEGTSRTRVQLGADSEMPLYHKAMSAAAASVTLTEDKLAFADPEDANLQKITMINRSVSASISQTWDRISDTRILTSFSTDGETTARTYGVGASQWYLHETLRFSFDLSRTTIDKLPENYLDYDSQEIFLPSVVTATGGTIGVRHLATPTTIVDYSVSQIVADDRPASFSGSVGAKQFIPKIHAAVHGTLTRSFNKGRIGKNTNYGQVDAWIGETAYLQELWQGALSKIGYRYYREVEITRAYEDKIQLGSDALSLGLSQDIDAKNLGMKDKLTMDVGYSRYQSNTNIRADSYEAGLTTRF